jgi:rhamnosyltransferase
MNDSCFGPFQNFQTFFDDMNSRNSDFWGISNHVKSVVREKNMSIIMQEHIQSYFFTFKNTVITSAAFMDFWYSVNYLDDALEVIRQYETQFTKKLVDAGFHYLPLIDTTNPDTYDGNPNVAHTNPLFMLASGSPLLKVKNFIEEPTPACILLQYICDTTDYPIELICEHIATTYNIVLPPPHTTNNNDSNFKQSKYKKSQKVPFWEIVLRQFKFYFSRKQTRD